MEPKFYHVQNKSLEDLIPKDFIFQIIHQMVVLDINQCVYLCTEKTGVSFTAVLYCPKRIKNEAELELVQTSSGTVSWVHQSGSIPELAAKEDAAFLKSKH